MVSRPRIRSYLLAGSVAMTSLVGHARFASPPPAGSAADPLLVGFRSPPDSARPRVW